MHGELKMKLLKKLMDEMDDSIMSKIPDKKGKGEPAVQVTEIEQKEMPISDLKEKMGEAMGDDYEKENHGDMAAMMGGEDDDEMDYPDDSSLMRRMKEAKRAKKAG